MNTPSQSDGKTLGSPRELEQLLRGFDTAMMTTLTPEGVFRARPMAIQPPTPELDCDLWFVTSLDSAKADEIAHEHQVGVSCYRSGDKSYLSISAVARVHRDPEQITRLFRPSWKVWFPDGSNDPTIAIIEMRVERAEYWSPDGGPVRVLFDLKPTSERTANSATKSRPMNMR
jgi:general stress protein 26